MPGAALLYMETAYTDARGRPGHDFVEFHAGLLGGKTLASNLQPTASLKAAPLTAGSFGKQDGT